MLIIGEDVLDKLRAPDDAGLRVHFPEPRLAMDNAEMMASLLWLMRRLSIPPVPFDAYPGLV